MQQVHERQEKQEDNALSSLHPICEHGRDESSDTVIREGAEKPSFPELAHALTLAKSEHGRDEKGIGQEEHGSRDRQLDGWDARNSIESCHGDRKFGAEECDRNTDCDACDVEEDLNTFGRDRRSPTTLRDY